MVLYRRRGGHAPPPATQTLVQHMQDLHYANLWFWVAGGGGHASPSLATQNYVFVSQVEGDLLPALLRDNTKRGTRLHLLTVLVYVPADLCQR